MTVFSYRIAENFRKCVRDSESILQIRVIDLSSSTKIYEIRENFLPRKFPLQNNYGILSRMQSIQNLGLAIVGLFVGLIVDSRGYLMLETFFLAMLSCTLIE